MLLFSNTENFFNACLNACQSAHMIYYEDLRRVE